MKALFCNGRPRIKFELNYIHYFALYIQPWIKIYFVIHISIENLWPIWTPWQGSSAVNLRTLQIEQSIHTTVDSRLVKTCAGTTSKIFQLCLTLTVGWGGARTGGSSAWKSRASFSAAFSLQDIWALGPSIQDPQGCLGPGWLCAMCRFRCPRLEAWVRQMGQRRTGGGGPNVGRGGGRSKGRGRGIVVETVVALIKWLFGLYWWDLWSASYVTLSNHCKAAQLQTASN